MATGWVLVGVGPRGSRSFGIGDPKRGIGDPKRGIGAVKKGNWVDWEDWEAAENGHGLRPRRVWASRIPGLWDRGRQTWDRGPQMWDRGPQTRDWGSKKEDWEDWVDWEAAEHGRGLRPRRVWASRILELRDWGR